MMTSRLLGIVALISYCGGPLFIADLLKPRVDTWMAFLITGLPTGLMLMGALSMNDDLQSRLASVVVRAGRVGLLFALGMHLYALWCFARGAGILDHGLHYVGIVVGMAWSVVYWDASRRWSSAGDAAGTGDPSSPKPIEPS